MRTWVFYTLMNVLLWGVWGAFSYLPASRYGYPSQMIYIVWAVTMIIPCGFIIRHKRIAASTRAVVYGLLIGLTGAGGQLILFRSLVIGPAYLIFPIVATSPAVTVILAVVLLKERINIIGLMGIACALAAIVLFSLVHSENEQVKSGTWLILAVLVSVCWGVQALLIKYATNVGISDATVFLYMTVAGLILIPVAYFTMHHDPFTFPIMAPLLTGGIQVLNAIGALFLVMALSRGKAIVVAPCSNALAPVLTVILSLVAFDALPTAPELLGIVLAIVGSAALIYADSRSADVAQ